MSEDFKLQEDIKAPEENHPEEKKKRYQKKPYDSDYSRGWSGKKLSEKYTTKAQVERRQREVQKMMKENETRAFKIKQRLGALTMEMRRLEELWKKVD